MNKKIIIWMFALLLLAMPALADFEIQDNHQSGGSSANGLGSLNYCRGEYFTTTVAYTATRVSMQQGSHSGGDAALINLTLYLLDALEVVIAQSANENITWVADGYWMNETLNESVSLSAATSYIIVACATAYSSGQASVQRGDAYAGGVDVYGTLAGGFTQSTSDYKFIIWNGTAPITTMQYINFSNIQNPSSDVITNNASTPLNATFNISSVINSANFTLYINDLPNQSINLSSGIDIIPNFSMTFPEGNSTWFINAHFDSENNINSTEFYYSVDTSTSSLTTNFVNRSIFYNQNITGQFNFTDNIAINTINISINDVSIFNRTGIGNTTYNYTLNVLSSSAPVQLGLNSVSVYIADGHTSELLKGDYDFSNGLFNDYAKFDFEKPYIEEYVKIYNKESSIFDNWQTECLFDRCTFKYKPATKLATQTFVVESSSKINILNVPNSKYKKWLTTQEHWIDFMPYTDISIKRISDNKVEVTVNGIDSKAEEITFNSIGDLNVLRYYFTFSLLNATETYIDELLESQLQTLNLYVDYDNTTVTDISAHLYYNDTFYYPTKTSNTTTFIFTQTLEHGLVTATLENVSHYWGFNATGVAANITDLNTSEVNQTIYRINLVNCSPTSTNVTLNFTVYDEITGALVNVDMDGSFAFAQNTTSSFNRSSSFSVDTVNNTAICIQPNWATLYSTHSLSFGTTSTYSYRNMDYTEEEIDNTTEQISLYVLPYANSLYARFVVVDGWNNPIPDAQVTMKSPTGVTLEIQNSDSSGLATFAVNPATEYTFEFDATGYPFYTTSLRIISSDPITIVLGTIAPTYNISYYAGIDYIFNPRGNIRNDTSYPFQFNITSSIWLITSCNFYLYNGTDLLSSTAGTYTDTECTAEINYNTGNYTSLLGLAIYSLNGTSLNVSNIYTVSSNFAGQFSFMNFLEDIRDFAGAGFNDFTRMLIALIVIVAIATVSIKQGYKDPIVIGGIILFLTIIFSYLGFLSINDPNIPIPTDWLRQYVISILVGLGVGAYLVKQET